jgi:predicted O-linked N-acetylglucosamine transferase (SPINDLY family)
MTNKPDYFREATALHKAGKLNKARDLYQRALALDDGHADALFGLGVLLHEQRDLKQSYEFVRRAIEADGMQSRYHLFMAQLDEDAGRINEAITHLRWAVKLNPQLCRAHNTLGLLLQQKGALDEALSHFQAATRCDPAYAKAFNNLGNAMSVQGRHEEAIDYFRHAMRLQPDYFIPYINLGEALVLLGRMNEAQEVFRQAAALRPDSFDGHYGLGCALKLERQFAAAEGSFRAADALRPNHAAVLTHLAHVLKEQGKVPEAIAIYQRMLTDDPSSLAASLGYCLTLPPVYQNEEEIQAFRKRYAQGLESLIENAGLFMKKPAQELVADLAQWGNFYLAYQGQDDRQLQERYSHFLETLLKNAMPEQFESAAPLPERPERRTRIGYLSSFLHRCTVGSYFRSWISRIDRQKFEVFVYHTGHFKDDFSAKIAESCDHFAHLAGRGVAEIARRVRDDRLDVLVYPEVGMDTTIPILANFRLAPVQCAAWGHPTTTGCANMDYFFSSELMEPARAAEHYSEVLLPLPGIGTFYSRPQNIPQAVQRSAFQLPEGKNLYLCPQSLFKIHPDNDRLFVEILKRDDNGVLVLFQDMQAFITQQFVSRLSRAFETGKLDGAGRVKILPKMPHEDFLQVNVACDVMLDTLYWSGGNTALDALACGLPMVVLPGEMMRGRQSYGMLKAMGLDELVAKDAQDYVEIAVRLANDREWRNQMSQAILSQSGSIFEDETPIRALERFYSRATLRGRGK